ncbi:hypothetical protein ACIBCM_32380 [Streptomyces sp. NPDC051018]|uniref:hypothetical protein n=1 Tax=Streptomyces sp. NPDC051018 TaxID=3365639 RepID=UPI0037AB7A73
MTDDEPQPSCYLLEFSVAPNPEFRADVYAHGTLAGLREQPVDIDLDLVLLHQPVVLHLWVVRRGEITHGIDLHPFLRTGSPEHDRTLAGCVNLGRTPEYPEDPWNQIGAILKQSFIGGLRGEPLPLATRLLTLHDKVTAPGADPGESVRAEYERLLEQIDEEDFSGLEDEGVRLRLSLDWDAIARTAPRLEEPLLGPGGLNFRWAEGVEQIPDSYLSEESWKIEDITLYAGRNDMEFGGGDAFYEEDEELLNGDGERLDGEGEEAARYDI